MTQKELRLEKGAAETIEVAERLIKKGVEYEVRYASLEFFQTHMNADSTEVRIKVKF